jgi:hypothetical protein
MQRVKRLALAASLLVAAWLGLVQRTTEEPARTAVLLVRGC